MGVKCQDPPRDKSDSGVYHVIVRGINKMGLGGSLEKNNTINNTGKQRNK